VLESVEAIEDDRGDAASWSADAEDAARFPRACH
jgi:hypothetical protein